MASINRLTSPTQDDDGQADPSLVNRLLGALGQTWPARLAQDAWSGVTAPGDAYTGRLQVIDPQTGRVTDDAIERATSLAGIAMTGGVGGVAGDAGAVMGSGPIRAYHGSPHDFNAFDLAKIGTGEGAQVYGHGLYFAENPQTALAYRDALEGKRGTSFPPSWDDPARLARDTLDLSGGDRDKAVGILKDRMNSWLSMDPKYQTPDGYDRFMSAIQTVQSGKPISGGRMYEVGIHADPQSLLDWNAPLSAQPAVSQPLAAVRADVRAVRDVPDSATGKDLYRQLAEMRGPFAAQDLNEAGIPGIKYLDQGSRGAGDGSRNLVVFNPQIVEIMRKYGVGSIAALPPAIQFALGMGQGQQQDAPQQPQQPVNRLLGPQT